MIEPIENDRQDDSLVENWVEKSAPVIGDRDRKALLEKLSALKPVPEPTAKIWQAGERVGNYRLLELIDSGGMGSVWLAEQFRPIVRKVAIKFVKPGCENHARRLETERQSLALLEHPNIARIFDAGSTPDGMPYFVMEHIAGKEIDEYVATKRLSLSERLEMFVVACKAIQFSHDHGVIHRDLKPANVLVKSSNDELNGVVKIIDFGLAKNEFGRAYSSQQERTSEKTILGSPFWMSPEQARGETSQGEPVDYRTDIYSLGALLYQLVTGTPPLDPDRFSDSTDIEILNAIQSNEIERPLRRIRLLKDSRSEPDESNHLVERPRRELEGVILKALSLQPDRRYQSATALADDLRRYLNNEPVSARAPSFLYTSQKWLSRNWLQAATTLVVGTIVCLLLLTVLNKTKLAEREKNQKDLVSQQANRKEVEAEEARRLASTAIDESTRLRAELARLDELFDTSLDRISPFHTHYTAAKKDPELLKSLTLSLADSESKDERLLSLHHKIANLWLCYDNRSEAMKVISHALQTCDFDQQGKAAFQANSLHAACIFYSGRAQEGLAKLERLIADYESRHGADDEDLVEQKVNLAAAYRFIGKRQALIDLCNCEIERIKTTQDKPGRALLNFSNILASEYSNAGDYRKAEAICDSLMNQSVADVSDDLIQIVCGTNMIDIYRDSGKLLKASRMAEKVWELSHSRFGESHTRTIDLRKSMLICDIMLNRKKRRSFSELEDTFYYARDVLGADDRLTMNIACDLASLWNLEGRFNESIELLEPLRETRERMLGATHPATVSATAILGFAYAGNHEIETAYQVMRNCFDQCLAADEVDFFGRLELIRPLATVCFANGREEEAFEIAESFVEHCKSNDAGGDPTNLLEGQRFLARMWFNVG